MSFRIAVGHHAKRGPGKGGDVTKLLHPLLPEFEPRTESEATGEQQ